MVEVVPSPVSTILPSLAGCPFYLFCRPHNVGHGEMVIARTWWHLLVDGNMGGALRIIRGCGFLGVGRNPCRLDTDTVNICGRRLSFLKGDGFVA
jgi:hypothetical protein